MAKVIRYLAIDNTEFDTEEMCEVYEDVFKTEVFIRMFPAFDVSTFGILRDGNKMKLYKLTIGGMYAEVGEEQVLSPEAVAKFVER